MQQVKVTPRSPNCRMQMAAEQQMALDKQYKVGLQLTVTKVNKSNWKCGKSLLLIYLINKRTVYGVKIRFAQQLADFNMLDQIKFFRPLVGYQSWCASTHSLHSKR